MNRILVGIIAIASIVAILRDASAQDAGLPTDARRVVDALFSGDEELVRNLIVFRRLPCVESLEGLHPGPQCLADESEGTLVDSFPQASCKGFNTRPSGMDDLVAELSAPGPQLHGVYRARNDTFLYGNYVAIYVGLTKGSPQFAGGVWIDDGGIAGLNRGCATTPDGFIEAYTTGERVELVVTTPAISTPAAAPALDGLPRTGGPPAESGPPAALLVGLAATVALACGGLFGLWRRSP